MRSALLFTYRNIVPEDVSEIVKMANACRDSFPTAESSVMRRLAQPQNPAKAAAWVACEGAKIAAWCSYGEHPYFGYLGMIHADISNISSERAEALLKELLLRCPASEVGLAVSCSTRFLGLIDALEKNKFQKKCEDVCQVLELKNLDTQLCDVAAFVTKGLRFLSVKDVLLDEDKTRSYFELDRESVADTPNFAQGVFPTFEEVVAEMKCRDQASSIICFEGERAVGFCNILTIPNRNLIAAGTGVARTHRKQKIALATKMESALRARDAGHERIYTLNEVSNAPMRRLNANIGFCETGREVTFFRTGNSDHGRK